MDLVQQWPWSSAEWGQMKNLVQLRSLLRHQRQWRCLQSFGTRPDAQVLRTLSEQLRTLEEVLRILKEQLEGLVVRTLKSLAVMAQLRNLAVRALLVKHLSYEQAS